MGGLDKGNLPKDNVCEKFPFLAVYKRAYGKPLPIIEAPPILEALPY
jgi:hypothetical protein